MLARARFAKHFANLPSEQRFAADQCDRFSQAVSPEVAVVCGGKWRRMSPPSRITIPLADIDGRQNQQHRLRPVPDRVNNPAHQHQQSAASAGRRRFSSLKLQ